MERNKTVFKSTPTLTETLKLDMKYSTGLSRWVLIPLGIWQISSKFLIFISFFFILFLFIPCVLHTLISEKDLQVKMKMIGPSSFLLMGLLKYIFLVLKKKKIHNCFKHIYNDWKKIESINDREIMLANAKLGRFIIYNCAIFISGSSFFYLAIVPIIMGSIVTPNNITIRPLPYPTFDLFIKGQKTPSYEIVFILQFLSGYTFCFVTVGTCSLAAIFSLHACGQFKIVMLRLENFFDTKENILDHKVDNRMAEIIERHLCTLRFIGQFEEILTEISGIELSGCTFNICFLIYYSTTEFKNAEIISTITYCGLLTSFTFNIFIFCFMGEILTQHGNEVGSKAYQMNWYNLPEKKAQALILIIAMSHNNNYSLTAGKMVNLSYETFCVVIKTAVAYFNFLRTLV